MEFWGFSSLQAKLQRFRDYRMLLRIAQAFENIFGSRSNQNLVFDLAILLSCRCRKKAFTLVNIAFRIKQCHNMVAEIDIDALKV